MNEATEKTLAQSEASARYLLAARAKQIRHLKDDVQGLQETVRLAGAFMALFALAAAEEPCAAAAIGRLQESEDVRESTVSKQALVEILSSWRADISHEEDHYRVLFQRADAKE